MTSRKPAKRARRKPAPPIANDGPTLEATDAGVVVHFDRMQESSFIGGAWPTIERCVKCTRTAARVGVNSWMHVGLMRLGLDNEPIIVALDKCGRVNANGVSASGLKSARTRHDNPPEYDGL
jgi:hypothetical protein